jgi:pimeloyl-ACP methyl ester carboxylesterase
LIRDREHVVSKDELLRSVWGGRIVSESTIASRINAVRRAIGDSGAEQVLIKTIARKGFRFVGDVKDAAKTEPDEVYGSSLRQEIRFCAARDGARIAYATVGEGPPLLKTANWLNHLEYDWQSLIWSHLLHALAAEHSLIRYDARGSGLSDWDVQELSFDAFVDDLECVVETTGLMRFPLLGVSQGCAVSIAYAVRHPERVSHLILYGGYARGKTKRGSQREIQESAALITLMRLGWGQDNAAFRQVFTSLFLPEGSAEQMLWFNDLQRKTASPENAARFREAVDRIDVTHLLPQVRAPTLVLHCRDDAVVPFEEGRLIAAGIPHGQICGARGPQPSHPRTSARVEATARRGEALRKELDSCPEDHGQTSPIFC